MTTQIPDPWSDVDLRGDPRMQHSRCGFAGYGSSGRVRDRWALLVVFCGLSLALVLLTAHVAWRRRGDCEGGVAIVSGDMGKVILIQHLAFCAVDVSRDDACHYGDLIRRFHFPGWINVKLEALISRTIPNTQSWVGVATISQRCERHE